jgi:hypothetical protein
MTKKPKEMDKKATSAICLNLGDRIIHNILEAQKAEQVWIKLECLYIRSDVQVVHEEAILWHANEGRFRYVGASQHF